MNQGTGQQGSQATAGGGEPLVAALAGLPQALRERLTPVLTRMGQAVERFFAVAADAAADARLRAGSGATRA